MCYTAAGTGRHRTQRTTQGTFLATPLGEEWACLCSRQRHTQYTTARFNCSQTPNATVPHALPLETPLPSSCTPGRSLLGLPSAQLVRTRILQHEQTRPSHKQTCLCFSVSACLSESPSSLAPMHTHKHTYKHAQKRKNTHTNTHPQKSKNTPCLPPLPSLLPSNLVRCPLEHAECIGG